MTDEICPEGPRPYVYTKRLQRALKAYPLSKASPYDKDLARKLCVAVGAVTTQGRPRDAALFSAIHIVCNYRYRLRKDKRAAITECGFHYSRNNNRYKAKYTGMTRFIVTLIDDLESKGYLINHRQDQGPTISSGVESSFYFTPKFCDFFDQMQENVSLVEVDPFIENPSYVGEIHLPPLVGVRLKTRSKSKKFIEPSNRRLRGCAAQESFLNEYNQKLRECTFSLSAPLTDNQKTTLENYDTDRLESDRYVHRIYADYRLETHGRLYGGFWQGLPSSLRHLLCIDGEAVVEVDFRAMHPSLLYAVKGLEMPEGDIYELTDPDGKLYNREWIKNVFMFLLNSKYRGISFNTFRDKILKHMWDMQDSTPYDTDSYLNSVEMVKNECLRSDEYRKELERRLKVKWEGIWPALVDKQVDWRELTKLDSDIAYDVIKDFAGRGIAVLSIHDSFLVQERYKEDLVQTMYDKFIHHANPVTRELAFKITNKEGITSTEIRG